MWCIVKKRWFRVIITIIAIIFVADTFSKVYNGKPDNIAEMWRNRWGGEVPADTKINSYVWRIFFTRTEDSNVVQPQPNYQTYLAYMNHYWLFIHTFTLIFAIYWIISTFIGSFIPNTSSSKSMHALAPQKYTSKNREDARSWLDSFELYTQSEQIFDDRSKAINFLSRLETEVNKVVWTSYDE